MLTPGTLFAGRYRIVRELAAGGMGAVYEVVHVETERRRALKVMHPHLFQSDELRERFKRETRIAAHVESEHIVDVSDAGVDDATKMPFLVMELLRGEDLGERLKRLGPLPPAEVVTYLQQTALALDKTHANGIVHRDLKPPNLFLTHREDGTPRIKILDFGIAKVVREGVTATGATQTLGTPIYMAPEQFRLGIQLAPAADIYALGMMAYTLLVGHAYWSLEAQSGGDLIAFVMKAAYGPQEPATQRSAARGVRLPPGFDVWFAKVTAMNPSERFATASEAVRVLGEVFGTASVAVTVELPPIPASSLQGTPSRVPALFASGTNALEGPTGTSAAVTVGETKRSRQPALLVGAVLGLVVVVGVAGAWIGARTSSPASSPSSASPQAPTVGVTTSAPEAPLGDPATAASSTRSEPLPAPSASEPLVPPSASASVAAATSSAVVHPPTLPGSRSTPAAKPAATKTIPVAPTATAKLIGRE